MRPPALFAILAFGAGCPGPSLTSCAVEPDVTGEWTFALAPTGDMGLTVAPMTIDAHLQQVALTGLGLGAHLWGTLAASDPGAFATLTIPRLMNNNGSKTGAIFGCELQINVPIASNVSDDDVLQGPLRLALTGNVTGSKMMIGRPSTLIRRDDPQGLTRTFTWTGAQR